MTVSHELQFEWLAANGLGGFASGTVGGWRTRRYHALLLSASENGRFVLVSGFDAWVDTGGASYPLSSQYYADGTVHPDGHRYLDEFIHEPWPRWAYQMPGGLRIEYELLVPHQSDSVVLSWRMLSGPPDAALVLRPLLAMRDYHGLTRRDPSFCFDPAAVGDRVRWHPRPELPSVEVHSNGRYEHDPVWYDNFLYKIERQRGLDHMEDLASPGTFCWDLGREQAVWIASAVPGSKAASESATDAEPALERCVRLREDHRRRQSAFANRLERAADAYLIRSGQRRTIIAGYPWFTDWGRDTFIALRGLCLATGRLDDAQEILLAWSQCVDRGMLPNRFPDRGGEPEFNSVDASLWYIIAVDDFLQTARQNGYRLAEESESRLQHAVEAILRGYQRGTRFGIHADDDGLLAAGEPGVQLTWMDAKVGDWVVTPRIGKPVEVQALWINALAIAGGRSDRWSRVYQQALESFRRRFWNDQRQCLYDVVDVDHRAGEVDDSIRPNQIFAIGGLPLPLLTGERAQSMLEVVQRHLVTPLGLRTLSPEDPRYCPVHQGSIRQRDGAYHQGTVWLWLAGPWIEAWVRTHGKSAETVEEIQQRWIRPLVAHLEQAGLGHLSEIADGDPPHTPRGCPFQAWSLGELLRIQKRLLA